MINFNPKDLKNKIIEVECLRLGSNFEGVCQYNGFTIFVNGAIPTEFIKIRIERVEKRYAYGKLLEIIKKSDDRQTPQCPYFGKCGGCSCQHLNYEKTLSWKGKKVEDSLKFISKIDKEVSEVIGLDNPWHSRNKTSLPVREVNGKVAIGFYKKRSHDVIEIEQ
ncbi:MAG: class I SAM-dependent RNA methyltransferase, partial [Christensenellaceae bacterium]|nr:class I SAM-dependent RNA methyltransferase [Christensenellaceae bacterium]